MDMLSFGGGVNSTALAILLINEDWRGHVVFSDTGCEWPDTYCFMDYFEANWLRPRGFEIVRLRPLREGKPLIEYSEARRIIPLAAMRWCTDHYKIQPMRRYMEEHGCVRKLLGISAEESHRAQDAVRPLVDRNIDRDDCIAIIEAEGLSVPMKSGCYICPFQRNEQWRMLWKRYPELFDRAMRLEENTVRDRTKFGRGHAILDASGKRTLRQRKLSYESQIALPGIDMDELRAYQPCVCTL